MSLSGPDHIMHRWKNLNIVVEGGRDAMPCMDVCKAGGDKNQMPNWRLQSNEWSIWIVMQCLLILKS